MKIALVLDDTLDKSDGVQQAVLTLGHWLKDQGHTVHYLVANTERKDIPNVISLGRFVNLRYNKNNVRTPLPASRKKIKELMSKEEYDVVHVMMPYSPLLGQLVVQYAGKQAAIIGSFHTMPASWLHNASHHGLRLAISRSLKKFDHITAPSEPTVHFARNTYGLATTYVPNPVVVSDFSKGRPSANYRSRNKINIVFLGRLVKRKGIMELIRAYNLLDDEIAAKTRLVIGGKGPLKQKAKDHARTDRDVVFEGFIPEKAKADFLASADIAVFPSTSGEAFGIVLIEAMAAGSGVVLGGSNPGYKSVLAEQPYLIFDPSDVYGFVEHLTTFIEDEGLRKKMHQWQEKSVQQYDISIIGKTFEDIYKTALKSKK